MSEDSGAPTCPRCGFTEKDLSRTTFLGCPHCYETFEFQLLTMLLQMHPGEAHCGKAPLKFSSTTHTHANL